MTAAVDAVENEQPRLLQVRVNADDTDDESRRHHDDTPTVEPNIVRASVNHIDVFIARLRARAMAGGAVTTEQLRFDDPAKASARVTVVLVPMNPPGPAQTRELDVPRVGPSTVARFELDLRERARTDPTRHADHAVMEARLVISYRSRVLQTAILTGSPGEPAVLREHLVVRRDLAHLGERRGYDLGLVLNHDTATGTGVVTAIRQSSAKVSQMPELDKATTLVRTNLIRLAREVALAAGEELDQGFTNPEEGADVTLISRRRWTNFYSATPIRPHSPKFVANASSSWRKTVEACAEC